MSSLVLTGDTSGAVTLAAPAVAGTNTLTLLAATATNSVNVLGTAVASTSGTSINFTSLPSWVKRLTVLFSGVSTSGTSNPLIQIGSGSVSTSGYTGSSSQLAASSIGSINSTAGFVLNIGSAANIFSGSLSINLLSGNIYVSNGGVYLSNSTTSVVFGGSITLSGALDRVRITTVGGTDTFDAGSINILYEG